MFMNTFRKSAAAAIVASISAASPSQAAKPTAPKPTEEQAVGVSWLIAGAKFCEIQLTDDDKIAAASVLLDAWGKAAKRKFVYHETIFTSKVVRLRGSALVDLCDHIAAEWRSYKE